MNSVVGKYIELPISSLMLDKDNPRFQSGKKLESQVELANRLIMAYDVHQIAKAIAMNGYFASSPMVVVEADNDPGKFIVVEGNRRLSALKALSDQQFRDQLFEPGMWNELVASSSFNPNTKIPAIVVDRSEVELLLGFRHISGDLAWQPLAQARWVARVIDDLNYTFDAAANTSGKSKADIISMYRNQAIAKQAVDIGFSPEKIEANFSNITLAMSSPALRNFIEAPGSVDVKVGQPPIPKSKSKELGELLTWLYGDEEKELPPVVPESRQISKLGVVIQNPKGLEVIRESWDLVAAENAIKEKNFDPLSALKNRLNAAKSAIQYAITDLPEYTGDEIVIKLTEELQAHIAEMAAIISRTEI